MSLSNLAVMAQRAGQTQAALSTHMKILAARQRVLAPDDPELAATHEAIALGLVDLGRPREAESHARQALAIRQHSDQSPSDMHRPDLVLAQVLMAEGHSDDALAVAKEGAAVAETDGAAQGDVALAYTILAKASTLAGDADGAARARARADKLNAWATLDRNLVNGIRAHLGSISQCYRQTMQGSPSTGGKIVARMVVQPDGTVTDVTPTEDTVHDADLTACVVRQLSEMHLAPHPGPPVMFSYPFVFTSAR